MKGGEFMEEYRSCDLAFLAVLFYLGKKFSRIEEVPNISGGSRKEFVFDKENIPQIEEDFYSGNLSVDPLIYWKSIQKVKNFVFGKKYGSR